jgi:hypothetical protein
MASAGSTSLTVSDLLVSTLDAQGKEVFDQVFEKIPTVEWMRQNNNINWDGTGNTYHCPITIAKNTSSGKTSGYKTVSTVPQQLLNYVYYPMRRYYASVVIDQDTLDINAGNRIVDLATYYIDQAKLSIMDNLSTDLFATSVATDAIESLATSIDSTGAVGGLNQSSESDWAAYEASCGSFSSGGVEAMQLAFNTVSKGKKSGTPGLIVTDQTSFQYYQNSVRAFGGDFFVQKGDLGVPELKFMGAKVIWDPDCTSGYMYFLNNNAIGLVVDGKNNMKATEMVKPADQLAKVGQIYCRLQLVTRERRALGKLTGITA